MVKARHQILHNDEGRGRSIGRGGVPGPVWVTSVPPPPPLASSELHWIPISCTCTISNCRCTMSWIIHCLCLLRAHADNAFVQTNVRCCFRKIFEFCHSFDKGGGGVTATIQRPVWGGLVGRIGLSADFQGRKQAFSVPRHPVRQPPPQRWACSLTGGRLWSVRRRRNSLIHAERVECSVGAMQSTRPGDSLRRHPVPLAAAPLPLCGGRTWKRPPATPQERRRACSEKARCAVGRGQGTQAVMQPLHSSSLVLTRPLPFLIGNHP